MALYKAIKKGFDGQRIILPGEAFEFSGKKGSWMELVEGSKPLAAEEPRAKVPKKQKPVAEDVI